MQAKVQIANETHAQIKKFLNSKTYLTEKEKYRNKNIQTYIYFYSVL